MDKLYAPWRDQYVMSHIKKDYAGACVFCIVFEDTKSNEQRYVLYQDADVAILLNLYPYNGGHLLVIPMQHVENLHDLPEVVLGKLMKASSVSMKIIKQALACEAINFGANIGRAAGAGIPEHVHLHIVPRFAGDTGFFTTIGDAKQVSVDLHRIYQTLLPHFKNIMDCSLSQA